MLRILAILTAPFRFIGAILQRLFRSGAKARSSLTTARKAAGSVLAGPDRSQDAADAELAAEEGGAPAPIRALWTFFFRQLPRPQVAERSASELTLDMARSYVQQADGFFSSDIELFARGDIFYEEVEEEYLRDVLGAEHGSIDTRFLEVAVALRKTLNDNSRRLFLVYLPALTGLLMAAVAYASGADPIAGAHTPAALLAQLSSLDLADEAFVRGAAIAAALLVGACAVLLVLYKWPYEVSQQRSLFGFDNYVSNKYARVSHNYQVAKRKALNVERDKLLDEADALKDEAAVWTLAYHWFAFRLLLCDLMIRNMLFQVRRNTALYGLGGLALSSLVAVAILLGAGTGGALPAAALLCAGGLFLLVAFGFVTRDSFAIVRATLEANQWNRFRFVNLAQTIADHVGEDKVQIVTFRDRLRPGV